MMPGARDFRIRRRRLVEGIPLPEATWRDIGECAERLGVSVSPPADVGPSP
jgi:LDH2 family malate/lactate/ureidoglycolate dehydrogenase